MDHCNNKKMTIRTFVRTLLKKNRGKLKKKEGVLHTLLSTRT